MATVDTVKTRCSCCRALYQVYRHLQDRSINGLNMKYLEQIVYGAVYVHHRTGKNSWQKQIDKKYHKLLRHIGLWGDGTTESLLAHYFDVETGEAKLSLTVQGGPHHFVPFDIRKEYMVGVCVLARLYPISDELWDWLSAITLP